MGDRRRRTLERWLGIITALARGRRLSVTEMAERFGVSPRTIYRDIKALDDGGIPIYNDGGRYTILESYHLPPLQFTPDEVLVLTAALDFARRRQLLGSTAGATAMDKLVAALPRVHRQLAAGLESTVVVDPLPAHSAAPTPRVEATLRAAVQEKRQVRIRYHSLRADEETERTVHPYGLVYRGTSPYLIGYCELRQGRRTFRVSRILEAEVLPDPAERPADFDLNRYLAQIWGIEDGPLMQVRIRFDPAVAQLARETRWHPTQEVEEEPDGSVVLTMVTRGKNELARWIAGYGGAVEVLAPPELREAVRAIGREIVERYTVNG